VPVLSDTAYRHLSLGRYAVPPVLVVTTTVRCAFVKSEGQKYQIAMQIGSVYEAHNAVKRRFQPRLCPGLCCGSLRPSVWLGRSIPFHHFSLHLFHKLRTGVCCSLHCAVVVVVVVVVVLKVFEGNSDSDTVKHTYLEQPITARFLRFQTVHWTNHPSMRVEIVGCQRMKLFSCLCSQTEVYKRKLKLS